MWRITATILLTATLASIGCSLPPSPLVTQAPPPTNPLFVPIADRDLLWNQVVDSLDDHFRIRYEQRSQVLEGIPTEGSIVTYPKIGSTVVEPWRSDSTSGFERLHATLQTIRRRAEVRVIPTNGGYLLEVEVYKELEDLIQPEHSSAGYAIQQHSTPLHSDDQTTKLDAASLGWIPLGRDIVLEQRILSDLRARLVDNLPPGT